MTHYRFYEIDVADHVSAGYSVDCPSDEAAMSAARRLAQHRSAAVMMIEVWRSAQQIGRVRAVQAMMIWREMRRQWLKSGKHRRLAFD